MKLFKPNDRYTKIAIYACATIICCIVFVMLCINLPHIFRWTIDFLSALKSIFYGVLISLIAYPIARSYDRMLRTFLFRRKDHPKLVPTLSIFLAYFTMALVIFVLAFAIAPQMSAEFNDFRNVMVPKFNEYKQWFITLRDSNQNEYITKLLQKISDSINLDSILSFINYSSVISVITTVVSEFYNIVIGLFISVYLILSRKHIGVIFSKISIAVFDKKITRKIVYFLNQLYVNLTEYISVRMISSFYLACLTYSISWLVDIPFHPLIALLVFVGNLIPFFGPVVVTAGVSLIMLLYSPLLTPFLLIILIGGQIFDNLLIEKTMLSRRLRPNVGITIVLVILAFITIGIAGVFICIPVYATLASFFNANIDKILLKKHKKEAKPD